MPVLILKNIPSEGPGTIEGFLRDNSVLYTIVEYGAGESVPSLEGFDALIMLGGPMGVYEMDKYPHLAEGSRLLREAIDKKMRVLGVCLGAQLMAHALGARVYKGAKGPEIGWLDIELTAEGVKDPLMRKLALHPSAGDFWRRFKVFQWHGDTFDIPAGAVRLASSPLYENQSFRYGDRAYALQFHIEITREMLSGWFMNEPNKNAILSEADRLHEEYNGRAMNFYKDFFDIKNKC